MKEKSESRKTSRREFIQKTVLGASAVAISSSFLAKTTSWQQTGIPNRPLGKTGVNVPIIALGGWHIGAMGDQKEATRIMHTAIDEGVTFFDNSWDYHAGGSEELMGKALAQDGLRKKVFLMTKVCDRDYEGCMKMLEDSLRRLKTDHIDLWQFHEIGRDYDAEWIFEKGGFRAAMEAQKAGKVRFIGFTGHKDPRHHLSMLDRPYTWASSQMPINILDANYRSFQNEVVPVCLEKGVGVLGMKALGSGTPATIPTKTGVSAESCRRYALSLPISSLVCGMQSMKDLRQDIGVARDFKPMSKDEMKQVTDRVMEMAQTGRYEGFKSTSNFDGPHHRG